MTSDKLAAMANQIAGYFQSYPTERAVPGIANHIEKFWTPRMRETLRTRVATDATGIHALVVAAFGQTAAPSTTFGGPPPPLCGGG